MNKRSGFIILAMIIVSIVVHPRTDAQSPRISFQHFNHENGLPGPVTQIAQDKYGFLWLGTTDGLFRFDGVHFRAFRNTSSDSTTLPNNIINEIKTDGHGRIWVATNRGLAYYDYRDDIFHKIHFDVTQEKIDQHRVHAIAIAEDRSVWFATRSIIHHWKPDSTIQSVPLPAMDNLTIKYLHFSDNHKLWIGTNFGIMLYDIGRKKFLHHTLSTPFTQANNFNVTVHPIITHSADTVFAGTWYGGLQKVYFDGTRIQAIPFTDPMPSDSRKYIVRGMAERDPQIWWIGTYGTGLSWFHSNTNQFEAHFRHDPSNAESLSDDYINDIFKDDAGIIWIATNAGLDKFDPLTQQFHSIPIPVNADQFSIYRLAGQIIDDPDDKQSLWMCVSGVGLFHFNSHTHQFRHYRKQPGDPTALPDENIYCLYYDTRGKVWVGTRSGVYHFNPKSGRFSNTPITDHPEVKGIHTFVEDSRGNIWMASYANGIHKYNPQDNSVKSYTYMADGNPAIPDNRVFCMLLDAKQNIWLGTQNRGLCRLDPSNDQFTYFMHVASDPTSIPDNGVYDLFEDEDHHLWISTENGLAKMDLNNFQITQFTTADGLCNNNIFSITPDENKLLWLATNNGLSHFNPTTGSFRNYYMNDGLPVNRIDGDVYMSHDKTMYFGSSGMLSYCHPDEMKRNHRIPEVMITDYSILGKKVPVMREGAQLEPIHLSPKENMITFQFAALNFTNAFLNKYAYRLEGFDANWIDAGHQTFATYTNLNGGQYTFRVKAANNDGLWNETGTSVLLIVHPPFWKTWWFYTLVVILLASVLYLFYRIRINQLMRLQSIRSRIARDLHDDIGSTLSSINIISSMAKNESSPKKSNELFNTISTASSQAMELMSDIVWSINPNNDRMEMIITRMRQYASEILEAAHIDFEMHVDEKLHDLQLPLEMRKDFYLIFKEAINNLAKHSQASKAVVEIHLRHHQINLIICDNGKGFQSNRTKGGNGLKNMQARTHQLKGQFEIQSGINAGTKIEVTIPSSP